MKYFVWFNVLIFWLAVISTRKGTALLIKKCRQDVDCSVTSQTCHGLLKICVTKKRMVLTTRSKTTTCKTCLANEYCHPIFKMCLPILNPPSTRNSNKPTAPDCKDDRNCTTNKYCHKTFKKCLDIPVIPTMSTAKRSTQSCRNDSACAKNRYCHGFFKICLVRPTVAQNVTTSPLKFGCSRDLDCYPGQYCLNMTNTCLQVRNLSSSDIPPPASRHGKCKTDSDCRINQFCYRLLGWRSSVAVTKKHRRKCSGGLGCSQTRRRHTNTGVCITNMRLKFRQPATVNCSRDKDCGDGMCCLTKLGLCKSIPRRGDPCVTQAAFFTCPCSTNFYCKQNPKKKKLKGKRLERRLKLSKHIRKELKKRGLNFHTKYIYGKCHKIST